MPVYKDSERGTWYASFDYINWQGERKRKKKRGFKLKREAEDFEREFLLKNAGSPDMTFGSLLELYFDDCAGRVRNSTLETKKNMIETHISPHFERRIISEIDKSDIRRWQNAMLKKINPKTRKAYAPTYLRSINSQLSAVLNFAVEYYKLPQNPCSRVKAIGKKRADEMRFWTLDQFNEVIVYEDKPAFYLAFMMLYWGGMREGELLALTPRRILDATHAIDIKETYKREHGKDILDATKSPNSVRKVTLPCFVFDELKNYMNLLYGLGQDDRIFYFTRSALNKELDRIIQLAGIKKDSDEDIRVHDLRHSHVALLIELGYRTHAIAGRIGDTPAEVDRTYAHLYPNKGQHIALELEKHQYGIVRAETNSAIDEDGYVYNDNELAESLEAESALHSAK